MNSTPTTLRQPPVQVISGPAGDLAYRARPGRSPTVVFLPGFKSDMDSTKATAIDEWARRRGQACLRLDYAGHGQSAGAHADGTISSWTADALAVIDGVGDGPLVLVGSSMGGWIMTLVALARPSRLAGLVGIAAAPDFADELVWNEFTDDQRTQMQRDGYIDIPSDYDDEPMRMTYALIQDGIDNKVLNRALPFEVPVRLLHSTDDNDVPWTQSQRLAAAITGADVRITVLNSGGHRLSRPQDLSLITATVQELCDAVLAD